MGKSTIYMAIFNSKLLQITRGYIPMGQHRNISSDYDETYVGYIYIYINYTWYIYIIDIHNLGC